MSTILTDHLLRVELRSKGLKRAAEFTWERCADQTAKVYEYAKGAC
jgi:glycosyltransferase involved in cell wall biosynthesis